MSKKQMIRLADGFDPALLQTLRTDCARCQGLCCVALFRARSDGFPADLPIGIPCPHLLVDFRCAIHDELTVRKLRGCTGYDCLGAGQAASGEASWRESPADREELFSRFYCMFALHQILWMLGDTASLLPARPLFGRVAALIEENRVLRENIACTQADIAAHKQRVNVLLREVSALVKSAVGRGKAYQDCAGRDLRGADLRGADFSMSLLIDARLDGCDLSGCNFLGADLRNANFCNADLRESFFLTPMQLHTARIDRKTLLPAHLSQMVKA